MSESSRTSNTQIDVAHLRERLAHTWKQHGDLGFSPTQIEAGLSLPEADCLLNEIENLRAQVAISGNCENCSCVDCRIARGEETE